MGRLILFGAVVAFGTGLTFDILRIKQVANVPYAGFIAAGVGIAAMLVAARRQDA